MSEIAANAHMHALPRTLLGLVIRVSSHHQVWLCLLSGIADTAPIEVQRRLVNAAVKGGDVHAVMVLAGLFAGLALVQGLLKLVLNIYRSWAGESALKWLRNEISKLARHPATPLPSGKAGGVEIAMVIAEADPIGGFVGSSFSDPLFQGGIMVAERLSRLLAALDGPGGSPGLSSADRDRSRYAGRDQSSRRHKDMDAEKDKYCPR